MILKQSKRQTTNHETLHRNLKVKQDEIEQNTYDSGTSIWYTHLINKHIS